VGAPSLKPENWAAMANVRAWFIHMMKSVPSQVKNGLRSLIILTIWAIWRERNGRIFKKEFRRVPKIVESIIDEANIWAHAGNKGLQLMLQMPKNAQGYSDGQPSSANVMVANPLYAI
jgi:hypothetical protein